MKLVLTLMLTKLDAFSVQLRIEVGLPFKSDNHQSSLQQRH